jgi:hypothetical protein
MRALSTSQRDKVAQAIDNHARFQSTWDGSWRPTGNRTQKDRWVAQNSWSVSFRHEGVRYEYTCQVWLTWRHVYYEGRFEVDGERKTVRSFKRLLGED